MFLCKVPPAHHANCFLSSFTKYVEPLKVPLLPLSPVACQACQPASDMLITIDPGLDSDIPTPLRKLVRI